MRHHAVHLEIHFVPPSTGVFVEIKEESQETKDHVKAIPLKCSVITK